MNASPKPAPGRLASRPFRSLAALKDTASTSRVLNLGVVAARSRQDPDYSRQPMFKSCLNHAIILKHHLRSNERVLFKTDRSEATKILLPFEWTDLSMGGRSVFFGQIGYKETLQDELGIDSVSLAHDVEILQLIDKLPSLDPFLLREHLLRHDKKVAACYFDISPNDAQRMQDFVASELSALITLATGTDSKTDNQLGRMVTAILSVDVGDRLEPLRKTLGMTAPEFKEGAFSWRGFLYYKWVLGDLNDLLSKTLKSIVQLALVGPADRDTKQFVVVSREKLAREIQAAMHEVRNALKVYDVAFFGLVKQGNGTAFREFLLSAPKMFLEIGEKLGKVSHICSFWRYRFPPGTPSEMAADEARDFFREFDVSMAKGSATERAWS